MKRDPDQCPECARVGRHSATCSKGRCQRCKRSPAIIGPFDHAIWCGPCWLAVRKERQAIVAERLERLDGP
jgi:hypothetical protein